MASSRTTKIKICIRLTTWPKMYPWSYAWFKLCDLQCIQACHFSLPEQQNHPSIAAAKSEVSYVLHKTIWTVQTDKIMELTTFRATSWNPVWKCRMEDQVPCWWTGYKNSRDAKVFHKKWPAPAKTSQLLPRTAFSCYSSQDKESTKSNQTKGRLSVSTMYTWTLTI